MIWGVDVSSHQPVDYSTKDLSFVFVKSTEGRSYVNPKLSGQTATARGAGCVTGFYHFLWPGNIKAQAEYFVSKTPEREGELLACDWEWTSNGTRASNGEKDSFIKEVRRLRPHNKVLLYCNRDFWLNHDTTSYAGDGLWIADYSAAPGEPRIRADWAFHQYTDSPLDKNAGDFRSRDTLRTWCKR